MQDFRNLKRMLSMILVLSFLFGLGGVSAFADDVSGTIEISANSGEQGAENDDNSAEDESWTTKPVITKLYETGAGKIYLEWEGDSSCYRINVDGEKAADMKLNHAIIDLKDGQHQIKIVPVGYRPKDISGSVALDLGGLTSKLGIGSIEGSIDLGDVAKDIVFGTPSDTVQLDYTSSKVIGSTPEILDMVTDADGNVVITFTDRYKSDIYRIFVKSGKDVNYVDFNTEDPEAAEFIHKNNSETTIVLDKDYLDRHDCFIPELDEKYSFEVRLRKWPTDLVTNSKEKTAVLESDNSKSREYTPVALWKNAPEIEVSTQAGQGTVLLKWNHDHDGKDVRYKILQYDKILVVKKGEKELDTVENQEYEISDLVNGKYTFAVVPVCGGEEGNAATVDVEVTADWVQAPEITCKADQKDVKLTWTAADKVDEYHITVYTGSGSLLRFVNLDYKKLTEFDVPAEPGVMEYTYTYPNEIDPENGVKLKFEIYGVHHVPGKADQQSSTSNQSITLK